MDARNDAQISVEVASHPGAEGLLKPVGLPPLRSQEVSSGVAQPKSLRDPASFLVGLREVPFNP
eukprot:6323036-Alexandrium_andersonii.AAC.1